MSKVEMKRFDLSVIRPVKGKPGELVFEMTVTDKNVTDAVEHVYSLVGKDSGLIVLQTASVIRDKVIDPELRAAIIQKLGLNDPADFDAKKARHDYVQREAKLDQLEAPQGWAVAETSVE